MNTTQLEPLSKIGTTQRRAAGSIRRYLEAATPAQLEAGLEWYLDAHMFTAGLAIRHGYEIDTVAIAIAHLSPSVKWSINKVAAAALLGGRPVAGVYGASIDRARAALEADNPWGTFGTTARKTYAFARNITGDETAVTVDIWAARAAGIDETRLRLAGVYDAIADCYRRVALEAGLTPAQTQAIVWTTIRGTGD